MRIVPILFLSLSLLTAGYRASAQTPPQMTTNDTSDAEDGDDLMNMLEEETAGEQKSYTTATFKSTRIANGHSIENTAKGILDFRISHRFGRINDGLTEFFGLDGAITRIGFDYGITDWLMIGIGRSSHLKEFDGFTKVRLLRQTDGKGMPFSLSYMGAASIQTHNVPEADGVEFYVSNRMAYTHQLLLARKFSSKFSLQVMPTVLHYNLVPLKDDPNDIISVGAGGRLKLSNRISLTAEYYYVVGDRFEGTKNPLTIGFDIETGGHVFQLLFSNSAGITERNVIGMTDRVWHPGRKGSIHFGFNISRVFTIVKPKGFENSRNKIW